MLWQHAHMLTNITPDIMEVLAADWALALRDDGKSPGTIRVYTGGVHALVRWQLANGKSGLDAPGILGFSASIFDGGGSANTAISRIGAICRFSAWLAATKQIRRNKLTGIQLPQAKRRDVRGLTNAELDALIAACRKDTSFQGLRDLAWIELMASTGPRLDETLQMDVSDLDFAAEEVVYRKTKGSKPARRVKLMDSCVSDRFISDLKRYLEARQALTGTADGPLWVNYRGGRISSAGMWKSLQNRAAAAGIDGVHPHMLRHTFAFRYLANGGSEVLLMAICGWDSREMIAIYIAWHQSQLAMLDYTRVMGSAETSRPSVAA